LAGYLSLKNGRDHERDIVKETVRIWTFTVIDVSVADRSVRIIQQQLQAARQIGNFFQLFPLETRRSVSRVR